MALFAVCFRESAGGGLKRLLTNSPPLSDGGPILGVSQLDQSILYNPLTPVLRLGRI